MSMISIFSSLTARKSWIPLWFQLLNRTFLFLDEGCFKWKPTVYARICQTSFDKDARRKSDNTNQYLTKILANSSYLYACWKRRYLFSIKEEEGRLNRKLIFITGSFCPRQMRSRVEIWADLNSSRAHKGFKQNETESLNSRLLSFAFGPSFKPKKKPKNNKKQTNKRSRRRAPVLHWLESLIAQGF